MWKGNEIFQVCRRVREDVNSLYVARCLISNQCNCTKLEVKQLRGRSWKISMSLRGELACCFVCVTLFMALQTLGFATFRTCYPERLTLLCL
jgi:hypothetical protein